jgi:site-specific DNA-methyltransferase (adenine-specific)
MDWEKDDVNTPKLHPTQKPLPLLRKLIEIFTDEGDIVIDPCAGSGSTLVAAIRSNRTTYGFEIKKDFYKAAKEWVDFEHNQHIEVKKYGAAVTVKSGQQKNLFESLINKVTTI